MSGRQDSPGVYCREGLLGTGAVVNRGNYCACHLVKWDGNPAHNVEDIGVVSWGKDASVLTTQSGVPVDFVMWGEP